MPRKGKPWMGKFSVASDEELVIRQTVHNCNYWRSRMCKRETMEKYCREKGLQDPTAIVDKLIREGILYEPKKGYIALTRAKKCCECGKILQKPKYPMSIRECCDLCQKIAEVTKPWKY